MGRNDRETQGERKAGGNRDINSRGVRGREEGDKMRKWEKRETHTVKRESGREP